MIVVLLSYLQGHRYHNLSTNSYAGNFAKNRQMLQLFCYISVSSPLLQINIIIGVV